MAMTIIYRCIIRMMLLVDILIDWYVFTNLINILKMCTIQLSVIQIILDFAFSDEGCVLILQRYKSKVYIFGYAHVV